MSGKDLQYYLDHPEEANTPEIIEALAAGTEPVAAKTDEPVVVDNGKQDEKTATSGDPAKTATDSQQVDKKGQESTNIAADVTQQVAPKKEDNAKPEGVATRDGKHIIPYGVLESERDRRQAAENTVQELQRKLDEMQASAAKGTAQGDKKVQQIAEQADELLSPEDLEAMRVDFPALATTIDRFKTVIGALNAKVESLTARDQERELSTAEQAAKRVQEFIDVEPVLAHLQSTNPELWAQAIALEKTLQANPKFADTATRFAKVAERMSEDYGPFDGVPAKPTLADKGGKPTPAASEAARKAVEEQLKQSQQGSAPRSLSDLPSGEAPATDERASLENMSVVELGAQLSTMTTEQRDAFLRRL